MNVLFAGTPEFAARALAALLRSPHRVVAVLTQPDRPAGRGLGTAASPVKQLALGHGIRVEQPAGLKDAGLHALLRGFGSDVMVVAAYGLILPQAVLAIPRLGAVNIHASLLPRWRGAAPIQRALLAGDRETGISIMQMDAGLDTGPVLAREAVAIGDADTAGSLQERLAELGARLIVPALDALAAGTLRPLPQPSDGVTYAAKIEKGDARLDWREPAPQVDRRIRAFDPSPGASTRIRGVNVKLWRATPAPGPAARPGEILALSRDGIRIACGDGTILATELQRAGARRMSHAEFLRGFPLQVGERFEPGGG